LLEHRPRRSTGVVKPDAPCPLRVLPGVPGPTPWLCLACRQGADFLMPHPPEGLSVMVFASGEVLSGNKPGLRGWDGKGAVWFILGLH